MTKHDLKFDVHGKSGVPLARHFPARPRFHFHFPISLPHLFIFPAAAEAEAEGSPPRAATLFLISAKIVVYTMSLRMSRIVVPRPRSSVLLWQWLLQVFVAAAASICGRLRGFWGQLCWRYPRGAAIMQIVVDCPARNATPNCNLRHLHFVFSGEYFSSKSSARSEGRSKMGFKFQEGRGHKFVHLTPLYCTRNRFVLNKTIQVLGLEVVKVAGGISKYVLQNHYPTLLL